MGSKNEVFKSYARGLMNLKLRIEFFLLCFTLATTNLHAQTIHLNEQTQTLLQKVANEPQNAVAKMDLAFLFSEGKEFARAIALYDEALKAQPQNQRALNELCYLYTLTGQQQKAYELCEKLTQVLPEAHLSFDNLGLAYYRFGDFFSALRAFDRALTLAPEAWGVKYHIGQSVLALRDFALARDYFLKNLAATFVNPEDQAIFYFGLYEAEKGLHHHQAAHAAILQTYRLSKNPLYLGRVIKSYMKWHEVWFFFGLGLVILVFCQYLGKRLNRFLRNED